MECEVWVIENIDQQQRNERVYWLIDRDSFEFAFYQFFTRLL